MKRLNSEITYFFKRQNFTIVSTVDKSGKPHNSCKGLVRINQNGHIYLLDLYKGSTYKNLKRNPRIGLTAVDEHTFKGYCIKGKAKILERGEFKPYILKAWEKRIAGRITQRILKNIQGVKGHVAHPEALLPEPAHLILMEAEKIVDLTPHHVKKGVKK